MDAQVGPDWLFNYIELFRSFNVFSDDVSGPHLGSSGVDEDGEEEITIGTGKPSVLKSDNDEDSSGLYDDIPNTPPSSPAQESVSDAAITPPILEESVTHSGANNSASVERLATQTFMDFLFPEKNS